MRHTCATRMVIDELPIDTCPGDGHWDRDLFAGEGDSNCSPSRSNGIDPTMECISGLRHPAVDRMADEIPARWCRSRITFHIHNISLARHLLLSCVCSPKHPCACKRGRRSNTLLTDDGGLVPIHKNEGVVKGEEIPGGARAPRGLPELGA